MPAMADGMVVDLAGASTIRTGVAEFGETAIGIAIETGTGIATATGTMTRSFVPDAYAIAISTTTMFGNKNG